MSYKICTYAFCYIYSPLMISSRSGKQQACSIIKKVENTLTNKDKNKIYNTFETTV